MPAAFFICSCALSAALLGAGCTTRSEGHAAVDTTAANDSSDLAKVTSSPPQAVPDRLSAPTPSDTPSSRLAVGGTLEGKRCPPPNLIAHGFDDGKWGPFIDGGEGVVVERDSTANGGWSLRKAWRAGGHDGGTVWGRWKGPVSAVHARFRYKQDKTFDNGGIKKLVRFQAPGYGEMLGSLVIQWDRFAWAWDASTEDWQREFPINVGKAVHPDELRGAWHWYEVWVDVATDRRLRMKLWIDGQLRMDHTAPFPNRGVTYGTVQFTRTFNAPAATGTTWLDDLAVSTECIGIPDLTAATAPPSTP